MTLPNCGEDGIGPDDVAVVEFGIGDSGAVTYARPIYASRQGDVGLVFARAVAGWSWDPANVKDIPMLFRVVTRLELRCSTGNGALPLFGSTQQAFADWVAGLSVPPFDPPGTNEATRRLALLAELDRRRATFGPSAPALIPVLAQLVNNAVVASAEAAGHAATLQTIMAGLRVPAMARLNVDYRHAMAAAGDKAYRHPPRLDEAPYRDDPVALATLRLTSYDDARGRDRRDGALLEQVLSDPRLPPDHMLRIAALVRRANLRAASGDLVGAQADYASTGLSDQQCSIVDAKPSTKAAPASSSDYPIAMVRLGVEGWTSVQFDIAADGRTLNQRAVISYPPFIFGDSGKKIVSHAIFEQSYRPAGQLGCGGSQRKITFRM
jgi:hypothetical protein